MDYETFIKLTVALKRFINDNKKNMKNPLWVHKHIGIKYKRATKVSACYCSIKHGYTTLDRVVLMIICCKYNDDVIYTNCIGSKQPLKYMEGYPTNYLDYAAKALVLEKFMTENLYGIQKRFLRP